MSEMDKIDGEASLQIFEANAILPKFNIGSKTEVYTQLNYKFSKYNYENNLDEFLPENLNDLRLGFIVRHKFSEQWEMVVSPRLNARTDFSKDAMKYGLFPSLNVLGLKSSAKIENLTFGLGVSYNNDLNKNTVIPLGYLKYHNESVRIYAILPSFAYLMLTPSNKFEYGLSYNLDSAIFHSDKFSTGTSQNYMKTSNITVTPTLAYNFIGKLWLNAKAGYAMFRRFQVLDSDFEQMEFNKDNKFKSGFFAGIGISMRIE